MAAKPTLDKFPGGARMTVTIALSRRLLFRLWLVGKLLDLIGLILGTDVEMVNAMDEIKEALDQEPEYAVQQIREILADLL